MLAILLLSQGTPMMLGGDGFGRTQRGNEVPGTVFSKGDTYEVTGGSLLPFTMQRPDGGASK